MLIEFLSIPRIPEMLNPLNRTFKNFSAVFFSVFFVAPSSLVLNEKAGRADVAAITRKFVHANLYRVCVFYPLSFSHTSGHISARRKVSTVWYVWYGGGGERGGFFSQLLNG